MGNAGLLEFLALRNEAASFVESQCMRLRMQEYRVHTKMSRFLHRLLEECGADPVSTVFAEYRHAPDLAVGQKARGTYRHVILIGGQPVPGRIVPTVPLFLPGNLLLDNENEPADIGQGIFLGLPIRFPDIEFAKLERHLRATPYSSSSRRSTRSTAAPM